MKSENLSKYSDLFLFFAIIDAISFGIVLRLRHLVDNKAIHNMLAITVMGLEIYRLALTIGLHRKLNKQS